MTSDTLKLGKFLRQQREKSRLSQAEVAYKLGYTSPQFISNWERGLSTPPIQMLKKLAYFYGTDANELFEICLSYKVEEVKKDLRKKFSRI